MTEKNDNKQSNMDKLVANAIERVLSEPKERKHTGKWFAPKKQPLENKQPGPGVQATAQKGAAPKKRTQTQITAAPAHQAEKKVKTASRAPQGQTATPVQRTAQPARQGKARGGNLRVIPLGGLGEVGKNMMLIEYGENILVVDGGLSFPDGDMYGVDLVIPDYSYLIENKRKVRAILVTHAHEDHIGALPYILRDVPAPVYGARFTLGMLNGKLEEHKVQADLRPVSARDEIVVDPFKIEFIQLTHSIPDTLGLAITTPAGTIMIICDFKMDMSPIDGRLMDFGRISAFGEKGVLLLMSDSTNVERDGFTGSEHSVGTQLDKIFFSARGRIIFTSFASHVHRVQQAVWAANRTGRKVAFCGRGMMNMVNVATSLGYLNMPQNAMMEVEDITKLPANRVCIFTTGSQGEMFSGLTRMATGEHRQVQILPGDTVVISAAAIPGNERMVSHVVDNLFRLGANVVYERAAGIHVSGHASRDELKMLLNMVKPRFFLPIHGEYRMLYKHTLLAQEVGMPLENTIIMENGQVLELSRRSYNLEKTVPSGRLLVDGLGVGDVGSSVLRERRQLSEGGVVVVNMIYTKGKGKKAKVLTGPEIYTRGFIFEKEYEHIIDEMKEKVAALASPANLTDGSLNDLRNQIRSTIGRMVMEKLGRKPVIMTLVSEV